MCIRDRDRKYNLNGKQSSAFVGGPQIELSFKYNEALDFFGSISYLFAPSKTTVSGGGQDGEASPGTIHREVDLGGGGPKVKIGFRWFFNQPSPTPVEIVEEEIQEVQEVQVEQAPEPVYSEPVYQAPPQGTPVRALW